MLFRPLIACEHLTKIYKMGQTEIRALDNVTLNINSGEFVAIVGSSGSGKSTLMNMIGALDQPSSGSVIINGDKISDMSARELAQFRNRTVGFIFQQFQLLPKKTAKHNVALPLQYRRPKPKNPSAIALNCLEVVGLKSHENHRPTEMSGGQQQRVAIARALVGDPKLVLADEPTGALDSQTSRSIMELLQKLNANGITVIVITHDNEIAAYASRIVEFRDGQIISDRPRSHNI